MLQWIQFLSDSPREFFTLNIIRDQWELKYEVHSLNAQLSLSRCRVGPFWVSVSPFLGNPLPEWAIAAIIGGELFHGIKRFPRYLFGHEDFQTIHEINHPDYINIQRRGFDQFFLADIAKKARIANLVRKYREHLPLIFPAQAAVRARVQEVWTLETYASQGGNPAGGN